MRSPRRRDAALIALVALAIGGATAVGGCGADDDATKEASATPAATPAGTTHQPTPAAPVRGLTPTEGGLTMTLGDDTLRRGATARLRFKITAAAGGDAVRDFEVAHEKRMHLIVVRDDFTGFRHLHPVLGGDGTWSTPIRFKNPGAYRVYAGFKRGGRDFTLARDIRIPGTADRRTSPDPAALAMTSDGYEVAIEGDGERLLFTVTRDGRAVETERYLGAGAHLVALRESDMAFLHTHPIESDERPAAEEHEGAAHDAKQDGAGPDDADSDKRVEFMAEFPAPGRYRLFFEFKHRGRVHVAMFARRVR